MTDPPHDPSLVSGRLVILGVGLAILLAGATVVVAAVRLAGPPLPPSAASPWPAPGAPVDTALADAGARLYGRTCAACHPAAGGRAAGPDLVGVLLRRDTAWVRGMVQEPDSMLRVDPLARALFAEYGTAMRDTGLTDRELRAVVEYMRTLPADGTAS